MKLKPIIWGIQLIMIFAFLIFSFFPLLYALASLFPLQFTTLVLFPISLGVITIYGIVTLNLYYRGISAGYFSFGILFSFTDSFILSLGVVLSWGFYEVWMIAWRYKQLEREYLPYPSDSPERMKLNHVFQSQLISLSLLAWFALAFSWGVLFIAQTFYIQLGSKFGTLGISISLVLLLLLYLVRGFLRREHPREAFGEEYPTSTNSEIRFG